MNIGSHTVVAASVCAVLGVEKLEHKETALVHDHAVVVVVAGDAVKLDLPVIVVPGDVGGRVTCSRKESVVYVFLQLQQKSRKLYILIHIFYFTTYYFLV